MASSRVAVRYARSLVSLAGEKNMLEAVKDDMELISGTLDESRQLRVLMRSPVIDGSKKMRVTSEIFKGKISEITFVFLKLVFRKNREYFLHDIARQFITQYNQKKGLQSAEVVTAAPLTPELRLEITQLVKKISGREPQLAETIDPDIIGGFILTVGDKQLDASVSGKLLKLKSELLA